ncbi:hypothetical protein EJ04DRAFT_559155 [Polyplosphaeria fusca]|uniref:Heterokaryon incompatibility domain-containing protein n=1 Tax=Polyplosphaeria fusca TaxID=682080 RepID=A0A9P4V939_9PLEO|nr:hypothetical protein EJ04DRAFT_559155 [Polyplosphaeria fusca]
MSYYRLVAGNDDGDGDGDERRTFADEDVAEAQLPEPFDYREAMREDKSDEPKGLHLTYDAQQVFPRNIRMNTETPLIWIRELCLNRDDAEERQLQFHEHQEAWTFSYSCRMLNMDDFMEHEAYEEAVRLAPRITGRTKLWLSDAETIQLKPLPRHNPIKLGQWRGTGHPPLPFEYLPLDIVAREIRLVVLQPTKEIGDPLVAHLAHEPLHNEPTYECLFNITRNLDQALRGMRDTETTAVFWIDAICTNQADAREKSRQVPCMYSLYENATSVLIWLCSADEETDIAMDMVNEMAMDDPRELFSVSPDGSMRINYSTRMCRAFAALYRLLIRPYFTRVWVVQEVAMSSNPTAWCGRKRVGWNRLVQSAYLLERNWHDFSYQPHFPENLPRNPIVVAHKFRHIHRLNYNRYVQEHNRRGSLFHLALVTRMQECLNPRDKLYGLWDLASDTRLLNLKPDYSKPVVDVYIEFVKAHVERTMSLDIICAAAGSKDDNIPSWCPDWRESPVIHTLIHHNLPHTGPFEITPIEERRLYRASRDTRSAHGFFFNNRTLVCAGIEVNHVENISDTNAAFDETVLKNWRNIAQVKCHHNNKPLSDREVDEQFSSNYAQFRGKD